MLFTIPKELSGKVEFCYKDIQIIKGAKLTKKEQELFESTREKLHLAEKRRFGLIED